jgi:hypothetical protein
MTVNNRQAGHIAGQRRQHTGRQPAGRIKRVAKPPQNSCHSPGFAMHIGRGVGAITSATAPPPLDRLSRLGHWPAVAAGWATGGSRTCPFPSSQSPPPPNSTHRPQRFWVGNSDRGSILGHGGGIQWRRRERRVGFTWPPPPSPHYGAAAGWSRAGCKRHRSVWTAPVTAWRR